jgi:pSer/pThr/pTyr-binding forkhead associated (FHA) protein
MHYRIVPTNPMPGLPAQGWRLNLPETIGRNTELPISIEDDSISRSHCQMLLGPDEDLQVRDLGSLNGTYVNGERISKIQSLAPGDILQLGSVSLTVEFEADTAPGQPERPKKKSVMTATQPMKVLPPSNFTIQEVKKVSKQWWEFWKSE